MPVLRRFTNEIVALRNENTGEIRAGPDVLAVAHIVSCDNCVLKSRSRPNPAPSATVAGEVPDPPSPAALATTVQAVSTTPVPHQIPP